MYESGMISILGCYLPKRLRRWFIYLPVDLLLVLLLVGGGVLVYAATISSSPCSTRSLRAGHRARARRD